MSPPPATLSSLPSLVSRATARASAVVPASNGDTSKAPRGPFHTSVLQPSSRCTRSPTDAGPRSRIMASGGIASTGTVSLSAPSANSRATTASTGSAMSQPARDAAAMMARAESVMSCSHRDRPTFTPRASRKVLAMAPPMISRSVLSTRWPRASILVEILAPPTTAATGCRGDSSALARASSSACISRPAAAGNRRAMASVEAWARCAHENASLT